MSRGFLLRLCEGFLINVRGYCFLIRRLHEENGLFIEMGGKRTILGALSVHFSNRQPINRINYSTHVRNFEFNLTTLQMDELKL